MAKFAKLVVGKTYDVMGVRFVEGRPVRVDDKLAAYLTKNSQFEVYEDAAKEEKPEKTERELLLERAAELGITVPKKASDKKLAELIAEAERVAAAEPTEPEDDEDDGDGADPLDNVFGDDE